MSLLFRHIDDAHPVRKLQGRQVWIDAVQHQAIADAERGRQGRQKIIERAEVFLKDVSRKQ